MQRHVSQLPKKNYEFEVKVLDFDKNESTHDLTIGVSSLDRTLSVVGKPTTSQSVFYRDKIIQKLRQLGAKEKPEVLLKRYVFDFSTVEFIEWIRLSTDGEKSFLTYKKKPRGNIEVGKTEEIESEVQDFETIANILMKLSFGRILYQENKRHTFFINDIEFTFDSWPLIPHFLEVESTSLDKLFEGLKLIGLEHKHVGDLDIKVIYQNHNLDINSYTHLTFEKQILNNLK